MKILPTKENLKRRKVFENSRCDSCLALEETSDHLFWSCNRTQEIWAFSKLLPRNFAWPVLSFLDLLWFIVMVEQWDQSRVEKVVMVAWAIWQNRNEHRVGGKVKNGSAVIDGAMDYLLEYQACCMKVEENRPSFVEHWIPPPPQHYKINVDGAVFGAQKAAGIGILIRDAEGRVIGACSKKIKAPLGAVEVEAKALEAGIQFAKDLLIHDILLESDSLILINVLKELAPPPASVAAVMYGVLASLHDFRSVELSDVRRLGNRPAHLLAKHALGIADFSTWIEENPCFIEQALIYDVLVPPL